MISIVKKTKQQITKLQEIAFSSNFINSSKNKIKFTADTLDEKNYSNNESSDIFSLFNRQYETDSMKVVVKIDEDFEEDSSDNISEGGEDTVFGQGTNPKPEDETYISLLKNSSPKPTKIKINV